MAACSCRRCLYWLRALRRGLWPRLPRNPEFGGGSSETRRLRQRGALHPCLPGGRHPHGLGPGRRGPIPRMLAIVRGNPVRFLLSARRDSRVTTGRAWEPGVRCNRRRAAHRAALQRCKVLPSDVRSPQLQFRRFAKGVGAGHRCLRGRGAVSNQSRSQCVPLASRE